MDFVSYKDYDSYDSYSGYGYGDDYDYYYSYPSSSRATTKSNSSFLGALLGVGIVTWIIIIALTVLTIIGVWKSFVKAGRAGWESLIGGHNTFVRFELSGIKPYWIFLMFVPIANIVVLFWLNIEFAKSYGKGVGFGIGLTFLPVIFFPILGMGSSQYVGPAYQETTYNGSNQNYDNYNSQQYNNNSNFNNQENSDNMNQNFNNTQESNNNQNFGDIQQNDNNINTDSNNQQNNNTNQNFDNQQDNDNSINENDSNKFD